MSEQKTVSELMARLNPRSNMPDSDFPFGSGRSVPVFTDQDIAAAMGLTHIPDGARYLARLKYAQQRQFAPDTATALYMAVPLVEMDEWMKTRSHRPGLIREMSKLAVEEYIRSNICPVCNGVREKVIEGKIIKCEPCVGTGLKHWSIRDRAYYVSMPKTTWDRIWDDRLKFMIDILGGWDKIACGALRKRLFGP